MAFRDLPRVRALILEADEYKSTLAELQKQQDKLFGVIAAHQVAVQASCEHVYRDSSPYILHYGSRISGKYCIKCEFGLGEPSRFSNQDQIPASSSLEVVDSYKKSYYEAASTSTKLRTKLDQIVAEIEDLREQFQKNCKHEWAWTRGGSGCYGHEDKERYCKLCGL